MGLATLRSKIHPLQNANITTAYPSRFLRSKNGYRVFNAFLEDGIDLPSSQRKPDAMTERKILNKYGGLFCADDNIVDNESNLAKKGGRSKITQQIWRICDKTITREIDPKTGCDNL